MVTRVTLLIALLMVLAPVAFAERDTAQNSRQGRIVADLRSPDQDVRAKAVARALTIVQENRSMGLRQALVEEFLKEARHQSARESARQSSTEREGEYLGDLLQAVAKEDDPRLVPSLVRMMGTGTLATSALARFGEVAAGAVLDVAEDYEQIPSTDLVGALAVLTSIFDSHMRGRLSEESVRRTKSLLETLLTKRQDRDLTVLFAIDTAVATRDADLVRIVADIRDRGAASALAGSLNARQQQALRTAAGDALRRRGIR